ncbi:MAG: DUF4402 domain-containing protein, partial [Lamprocystis purpurea]|nr:DUF4402 domain-containing protein [Lamprocystis purpurea]
MKSQRPTSTTPAPTAPPCWRSGGSWPGGPAIMRPPLRRLTRSCLSACVTDSRTSGGPCWPSPTQRADVGPPWHGRHWRRKSTSANHQRRCCCWPIFGRFCGRENRPYRPQTLSSGCALSKSPPGKTTTTRNATTSGGGIALLGTSATLLPSGVQTYYIGGTLTVPANQPEGDYSGSFTL